MLLYLELQPATRLQGRQAIDPLSEPSLDPGGLLQPDAQMSVPPARSSARPGLQKLSCCCVAAEAPGHPLACELALSTAAASTPGPSLPCTAAYNTILHYTPAEP